MLGSVVRLSSISRLTERRILIVLLVMLSADVLMEQPEPLLDQASEVRIDNFLGFLTVEVELKTNAVMSVEVEQVIYL